MLLRTVGTSLVAVSCALAGNSTGLAFLKISPDAATAGMGELGLPGLGGPLQAIQQPAMESTDPGARFGVTQSSWIFDSDYHVLSYAAPIGAFTLGADLRLFSTGDFELREDPNPVPEGEFRGDGLAYGLRLSTGLGAGWRVGAALRRIQEKLNTEDTHGWSSDFGAAWSGQMDLAGFPLAGLLSGAEELRVGAALRNLGSTSDYINEAPDLPRVLSASAGLRHDLWIEDWQLDVGAELRHLREDGAHAHLGVELLAAGALRLRAGWMTGYDDRAMTAGLGFAWRSMALDYAWLPFDNGLDDIHRFSFTFGFLGGL